MPRASTGIVLRQYHASGGYILTQPGRAERAFDADCTLDHIHHRTDLGPGYWLRTTPEPGATVWTWVEL